MAKKILVVDDEPDLLLLVSCILQKKGYEVSGAKNGQEALELARSIKPDLIIMDVCLPDMRGDEVVATLKKDGELISTKTILISSSSSLRLKAGNCGADSSLEKPFGPLDLLNQIETCCGE